MRELLVTMTLLSAVSSEEFEPKKRFEIPPEEDPNFWPTRGRRSYWSIPGLTGNLILQDLPRGPEVDYAGFPRSWGGENGISSPPEVPGPTSDGWKVRLCPRRGPISLILPLEEYRPDETELSGCGVRREEMIRGRIRRGDERWRRQQPLYAEEPKWIAIDYNHGSLHGGHSMSGDEDPFIVARGKKQNAEILALRERRQLEDVFRPYDTDPFFVARGKRNVRNGDSGFQKESFEARPANKFDSKVGGRRASDSEDKNVEEGKTSSTENRKFTNPRPRRRSEDDDERHFLTDRRIGKQPSSTSSSSSSSSGLFQADENNWMKSDELRVSDGDASEEFSVVKPRYSRPRDKHSNLQNILDEPFFVSRGKKNAGAAGGVEYLRYDENNNDNDGGGGGRGAGPDVPIKIDEAREILKNIYSRFSYDAAFSAAPKLADSVSLLPGGRGDELELLFKGSKPRDKPELRNRRGMLDDLLKSDDPFYVARGKKFSAENLPRYFDAETPPPNVNGKFSLFEKRKGKKKQQGPNCSGNFPTTRSAPDRIKLTRRNFWNLSSKPINDIN